jgi:hypothetical protein
MEINEQLANAISSLIQGAELGQKAGAYDLNSAAILNQAVLISKGHLEAYAKELQAQQKQEVLDEVPQPTKETPVKKINSKK